MKAAAGSDFERRVVPAIAGVAALLLLLMVGWRIAVGGYLNHVSGAMAVLADDAAHGVVYRPLLSDLGYGGTRNFPLHFLLHGAFIKLGFSVRAAGHLLSLLSGGVLLWGGAVGLRRFGATPQLAWALSVLALASRTVVMGLAGIRGDLLPVALGIAGLGLLPRRSRDAVWPAGALLGLALLAKPTLLWAPAAAGVALLLAGQWRRLLLLAVCVAGCFAAGLGAVSLLSHGSMLASFRACASGGGFTLDNVIKTLQYARPGEVIWILGGPLLALTSGWRGLTHPLRAAAITCAPVTLLLLSSRGTHINHLLDPSVVGALAVGSVVADAVLVARLPRLVLAFGAVLAPLEALTLDGMLAEPGELEQAARALPAGKGPVLSEQPWLPLLAGERAFELDPYSLLQVRRSSKEVDRDFTQRLDTCAFRAVVLMGRAESSGPWYDATHFGPGFRQHLAAHYELSKVVGGYAFYAPRCGGPEPVARVVSGETILEREQRPRGLRQLLQRLHSGGRPSAPGTGAVSRQ